MPKGVYIHKHNNGFKKGHKSWTTDIPIPQITRNKISETLKRKYSTGEIKPGIHIPKYGENNPNYKNGKAKCVDCGAIIAYWAKRCKLCNNKNQIGKKQSKETIEKRRNKLKGRTNTWTEERRKKFSEKLKGHKAYPNSIAAIIKANTGRHPANYKGGYENRLMINRQRRAKKIGNGGSHTLAE